MKAIYFIILLVGVVLTFGTESLDNMSNVVGMCFITYSCSKLNLFYKNVV
jgi:hypothetical protein